MRRPLLLLVSLSTAATLWWLACEQTGKTARPEDPPTTASDAAAFAAERPSDEGNSQAEARPAPDGEIAVTSADAERLGEGFVAWESKRSGAWRIWRRDLDGSGLAQLSPDETGRDHCCAHVSTDGRNVVYLSLPTGRDNYGADDEEGALHLIAADGARDRVLAPRARTYGWGHRAALWHDARHLVYIDGEGATVRLDVERGEREVLVARGDEGRGWLIGATLKGASSGRPSFSVYDHSRHAVVDSSPLGGCEPYFTADGRWGYWIAGAGGPLNRFDLDTRSSAAMLAKSDPRLPARQGYVYFPMVSPDGHLLAVGASSGEHDHQTADYDVFVMALDPATLEPVGNAVQLTDAEGPDRYPSPFAVALPLGRIHGEAPLGVDLAPPDDAVWSWDFGDGARLDARRGQHTYTRAGTYRVEARQGEQGSLGRVTVLPAQPPRPLGVTLRGGGRDLVVRFDEPIDATRAQAALESGATIERSSAGPEGRSLVLRLAEPLRGHDRLRLSGAADRAQRPNPMAPAEIEVDASGWPSDARGRVFAWDRGDQANTVWDESAGAERAYPLEARGRARLDHDFAMLLGEGRFASADGGAAVAAAARARNEITVELTFEPRAGDAGSDGVLVWSAGKRKAPPNLALEQRGGELLLTLRRSEGSAAGPFVVGRATAGRRSHLLLSYTPGWLVAVQEGETVLATDTVQGDFFPWSPGPIAFGASSDGSRPWAGTIEGIAIYDRALDAEEAKENARRYRAVLDARPAVSSVRVEARRLRASRPPELREIAPYRQALVVHEYEVTRAVANGAPEADARGAVADPPAAGSRIRVAHWAILDGERQPLAAAPAGESVVLELEPYRDNRQLEGLVLADTLGRDAGVTLFVDVRP